MANISVGLHGDEGPVVVDILTLDAGDAFIVMRLGPDVSVTLNGLDHASAAQAREIAAGLVAAAEQIEATRPAPAAAPVVDADVPALALEDF